MRGVDTIIASLLLEISKYGLSDTSWIRVGPLTSGESASVILNRTTTLPVTEFSAISGVRLASVITGGLSFTSVMRMVTLAIELSGRSPLSVATAVNISSGMIS